ncbi:MAG: DNA replication/repair protein RecF [Alphaproteobacteria bacterium]|nr:DNA replication/repair protein RecF [Alphaproteobacteria bacterium]
MRAEVSSPALALTRIGLLNFRSYARAELGAGTGIVVLAGANGSGKTNLIEAISLLSPGRGLRGAKLADLQRKAPAETPSDAFAEGLWAVSATVAAPGGTWEIGTGLVPSEGATQRRTLHLNGAPATNADVAELLPMLWLTPAQDRLFLDGASERRRFLDRLVFSAEPQHARRATRYERAMAERLRLLRDGSRDAAWLDGLEAAMAEEGAMVSASRLETIARLNGELASRVGAFPSAHLALRDGLGTSTTDADTLRDSLAASRERDAESGRTNIGPHLADLEVRHTAKRSDARDCSTGEQKALLISIVLANARLQTKRRDGLAPLLLLDEIAAHLDVQRRAALFEEILALRAQAWLTGTDKNLFAPLESNAQFFAISGGQFVAQD